MRRASRILVATVLILMSIVVYQQKTKLNDLYARSVALYERPDLSVLDSCGIITNGQGFGSCVAVRLDLILTAGHCVDIGNTWIEIGGVRYEILDKWRSEKYDVGFVKIDGNLPFVVLSNREPQLLDEVYLVGTPLDRGFINKISKGIITNLNIQYVNSFVNWCGNLACDAMAERGNSGGPLFCQHSRIVGIYVGLFPLVDSFSVCEPISHIREALEEYDNVRLERDKIVSSGEGD